MQTIFRPVTLASISSCLLIMICNGCLHGQAGWDHRLQSLKQSTQNKSQDPEIVYSRAWANFMLGSNWQLSAKDFGLSATNKETLTLQHRQLAWLGKGMLHLAQADFTNALEAFLSAIELDPQSIYAWISAIQLQECAHQVPNGHNAIIDRLQTILAHKSVDPQARRTLKVILLQAHKRAGRKTQQKQVQKQLGSIPSFRVAYPFGKYSLLDMDSPFLPESTTLDKISKNDNKTIKPIWTFDRNLVLESDRTGVLYAESFFLSTETQKYCFRIQSDQPWSLFIDDSILAHHDSHRQYLRSVEQPCFAAPADWHRVLLKLAMPGKKIRLGVEMTLDDGRVDPKLRWWSNNQPTPHYQRDNIEALGQMKSPIPALIENLDKHSNDALTPTLAGLLLWEQGDVMAASSNFRLASQRCSRFCLIHYLEALIVLEDPDVPPGIDTVRSRNYLEKATKLCPDFNLAQFRLALTEAQQGFEEKALSRLDTLVKKQPNSFLWPFYKGKIQRQLGFGVEADKSLRQALALLPDNPAIVRNLFERANEKNALNTTNQLGQRLEQLGDYEEPISLWLTRGDVKRSQSLLEKENQSRPGQLSTLLTILDLHIEKEQWEEANKILKRAKKLFPGKLQLAIRQADLLDQQGKPKQAQKIRQRYSYRYPWQISLRKALSVSAQISHLPLAGALHYDGLKTIQEHKNQTNTQAAHTLLLLDQAAVEVAPDGSSLEMVHTIAQVLTPRGLERWGEIEAFPPSAEIIELRTIKPNGRFYEAEPIPGKESISMPGLQVGDYVEIKYIYPSRSNGPFDGAYLSDGFMFELQDTAIAYARYSVAVPKGTKLSIEAFNKAPKATKSTDRFHDIYTFEKKNTAALHLQPQAPPYQELAGMVRVGFGFTWPEYRRLMFAKLQELARHTTAIRKYANDSCTQDSLQANIRSIFRKVLEEIRQLGSTATFDEPAAYTLARGEGNRLVLLYSLLSSLGLSPKVYLAQTIAQAKLPLRFPSLEWFTHGLLLVELDKNKKIWLDPSQRYNSFARLYAPYANMTAIELSAPKGPVFTKLPNVLGVGQKQISLNLTLSKDGTLAGTGIETLTTQQAVHYRELLHNMSPKKHKQAFETGLTGYFPGAVLENYTLKHLHDPDQPLIFEYTFRAPGFARIRANALVLSGGFYPYQLGANLISNTTRTTPLLLSELTRISVEVKIELPKNAQVQLPKDQQFKGPLSHYQLRFRQKNNSLSIYKKLEVLPGRVPVARYRSFRKFCRQVDTSDTQALTIEMSKQLTSSLHSTQANLLPSPRLVQYSELAINQNQPYRK